MVKTIIALAYTARPVFIMGEQTLVTYTSLPVDQSSPVFVCKGNRRLPLVDYLIRSRDIRN